MIKELLADNSGEFDNNDLRKVLDKNGIQQRLTLSYTSKQNGYNERENRAINKSGR